jgi:low temperature requirement protein LtrA
MVTESVESDGPRRTGTHELFFDLVFVYCITQISTLLGEHLQPAGFAKAGLMLALMWWVWSQYTWAINAVDPKRPAVTVALLGAAGAAFFCAQAIRDVYGSAGTWFGIAYFLLHAVGLVIYWAGLADDADHQRALRTYIPLASLAPAIVLVGGLGPARARPWIWTAALIVDIAGALNAGKGAFRIRTAHFAERYSLIVIIALGEAIVGVGVASATLERTTRFTATALVALLIVGLLYLSYFGWVAEATERRLERTPPEGRARLARNVYTFLHLPIVAGIVCVAVADERIVTHPGRQLQGGERAALALGVGLFLAGFIVGNALTARTALTERIAAVTAVTAVCLLGTHRSALTVGAVTVAVLAVSLTVESMRRTRRSQRTAAMTTVPTRSVRTPVRRGRVRERVAGLGCGVRGWRG